MLGVLHMYRIPSSPQIPVEMVVNLVILTGSPACLCLSITVHASSVVWQVVNKYCGFQKAHVDMSLYVLAGPISQLPRQGADGLAPEGVPAVDCRLPCLERGEGVKG
jgi:hypothetical protein